MPFERAGWRQPHGSGELLSDGAAALDDFPCADIAKSRTCNPDRIETVVRMEAAILDRHDRMQHVRRDLVDGDVDSALRVEGKRRLAVAIENDRRLRACGKASKAIGSVEFSGHGNRESHGSVDGIPANRRHRRYCPNEQPLSHPKFQRRLPATRVPV